MSSQRAPPSLPSRLKASYDAIAPKYNTWTAAHSPTRLHYLDQLLARLPSTATATATAIPILELGCGHGIPVAQTLLTHPNITLTANDLSTTQIALARTTLLPDTPSPHPHPNHNRLTLLEADMLTLAFPPSSFTAIIAMYSLIHLPRDEQVSMLRNMVAWLQPGGWVLANFGAEEMEAREVANWLGEEKGWMFWSGFGDEGTVGKVREVGLEIVVQEVEGDGVEDARFLWVLARKRGEERGASVVK